MDGQEYVVWELTNEKHASCQHDAAQSRLAASFGNSESTARRLRLVVSMVLGLAAALVALVVR